MSSTFQTDFDRIALVSPEGELHNEHYHGFLLNQLRSRCEEVLEIGCGSGSFARALAARSGHVLALDLSPEMIRMARERSAPFQNIDFQVGDILDWDLPQDHFHCIASIATLHHLSLREMLLKMKAALKPGGTLLILDLFEPGGAWDFVLNPFALSVSTALRLSKQRRLFQTREARAAWAAHEVHDLYLRMKEVHALCDEKTLPNAQVRKHLLWRYSIVWTKPA